MSEYKGYSTSAKTFIIAVILAGMITLVVCIVLQITRAPDASLLSVLLAVTLLGGWTVQVPGAKGRISLSEVFAFTSLLLYGPFVAAIVGGWDGLVSSLRVSRSPHRVAFNTAVVCIATLTSGLTFMQVLAALEPEMSRAFFGLEINRISGVSLVTSLGVLAFVHYLVVTFLVSTGIALTRGQSFLP